MAQASYLKVKTTLSTYAAPVKGAGGAIKNSIQVSKKGYADLQEPDANINFPDL